MCESGRILQYPEQGNELWYKYVPFIIPIWMTNFENSGGNIVTTFTQIYLFMNCFINIKAIYYSYRIDIQLRCIYYIITTMLSTEILTNYFNMIETNILINIHCNQNSQTVHEMQLIALSMKYAINKGIHLLLLTHGDCCKTVHSPTTGSVITWTTVP